MKRGWCRTGLTLVAAGVLAGSLTACVPLLLGGGAVTTALVASDRRTSGMYLEDERIEQSAAAKLRRKSVALGSKRSDASSAAQAVAIPLPQAAAAICSTARRLVMAFPAPAANRCCKRSCGWLL